MNKRRAERVPQHMRRGTYGSYLIQPLWRPLTTRQNPQPGSPYYKNPAPHWMRLLYGISQASLSFSVWPYTCLCPFLLPDCHDLGFWHVAWLKRTVSPRDSRDFGAFFFIFFSLFPVLLLLSLSFSLFSLTTLILSSSSERECIAGFHYSHAV